MLTVLAFYFGNRFGQVFDFNTMEITDGALATVNSIVAAPAAISTASVPMLYAIGLAITVLIVWLYTFMYAGNYRYDLRFREAFGRYQNWDLSQAQAAKIAGLSQQAFSYHVNKITNAQDTRGRGLKPLPKGFDRLYSEYKNGDISARSAATKLGITHPTFLKYVKECDVRLHKDELVQTHNPRGLTERHAAATDAARNLNHDQNAPDSPLQDR